MVLDRVRIRIKPSRVWVRIKVRVIILSIALGA